MQIQDIVRRRQLLTVFREGKDGQQDVDVPILQALLKGEGQVRRGCGGGARVLAQRSQRYHPWADVLVREQPDLARPPHAPPGQVVPVTDVGV